MKNPSPTTVNLTIKAQAIKEMYKHLGLKGILSVGLELFATLSDTDKIRRVREAIAEDDAEKIVAAAEADAPKRQRKQGHHSSRVRQ